MLLADLTITIDAVAWYGAIVATLSVLLAGLSTLVSLHAVRRDTARLKLSVRSGMMVVPGPPPGFDTSGPFLVITAANIGRRPIHLKSMPWLTQKGTTECLSIQGTWQPTPDLSENTSAQFLAIQEQLDLKDLEELRVEDATGHVWSAKLSLGDQANVSQTH